MHSLNILLYLDYLLDKHMSSPILTEGAKTPEGTSPNFKIRDNLNVLIFFYV